MIIMYFQFLNFEFIFSYTFLATLQDKSGVCLKVVGKVSNCFNTLNSLISHDWDRAIYITCTNQCLK